MMSEAGLDIETIYKYDKHENIPWNIVEYQPVREYLDPKKMLEDQMFREGGTSIRRYVTKKTGFLDQQIKNLKDLPPPGKYECASVFDQTLNRKESKKHKIDFKLKKNSYLEQIEVLAKSHKSPGVGRYSLRHEHKSKSTKRPIKHDNKRFFFQDDEFLSSTVPGSGSYYPHDEVSHVKQDRTNPRLWVDKHKEQAKTARKRSLKEADPGTYRPMSSSFNTFDKMKVDHQKRQKVMDKKKPYHGFTSSDAKFDYNRTQKSKGEKRPDPCNYNTMIEWKGKGLDAKKNNWVRCLSAGPTRNVYH